MSGLKKNTLRKTEILKNKKDLDTLFKKGRSIKHFPVLLVYTHSDLSKVAFSVPKRNFKHAVDRNKIKRQLREAYRKNNASCLQFLNSKNLGVHLLIIYLGKKIDSTQHIEDAVKRCLDELKLRVEENEII